MPATRCGPIRRRRRRIADYISLDHRHLPAPDQDDHRAAGVLDAGRRRRAYGRHQGRRPHRRQGDALVHLGVAGVAAARAWCWSTSCGPATTSTCRCPTRRPSTNLKVASLSTEGFRHAPGAALDRRGDGDQRDPADRGVLAVLRRRLRGARRARAQTLVEGIEELSHVILKITGYIMKLAPLAVFASMAAIITTQGLGILVTYGKFVVEFYFGLAAAVVPADRRRLSCSSAATSIRLVTLVREPFLLAFSTASSEAAYPKMMEQLEKFRRSARRSSASCCRWAIRSISTAR